MHENAKKKLYLYRTILFFLTGGISTGAYLAAKYNENSETLVKVTSDMRDFIYNQKILNIVNYYNTLEEKFNMGPLKKSIKGNESTDRFITKELLNSLSTLTLDLCKNDTLNIVEKCPNLTKLNIENAQMLTDEDIEFLNGSKIKEITLSFELSEVYKIRENKFDVSRFKDKKILINFEENRGLGELYLLVLMNYLENYGIENINNLEIYKKYAALDEKLDKILEEDINIEKYESIDEKIMAISMYIINKIQYDKNLNDDKISYYNKHEFSAILDNEKEFCDGICITYSSFFDIFCYKSNIKTRIVKGYSEKKNVSHAWNMVYLEDDNDFIDLTSADNDKIIKSYLLHFNQGGNEIYDQSFYLESLKEKMFMNVDDQYLHYKVIPDLYSLDKLDSKKNIKYYNVDLDNKKIYSINVNIFQLLIIFLGTGFINVLASEAIKIKRLDKKQNNSFDNFKESY